MNQGARQPWLKDARFDLLWIISPAFLASLLVLLLVPSSVAGTSPLPLWIWVVCILGIDVSHVYSTLYRTYFDAEERLRYSSLLFIIPLGCWGTGVLLHLVSSRLFWSVLAYLAVFHFVRQQYGFVALYSRHEGEFRMSRAIDKSAVYLATIYPLVFWHTKLPRNFDWFVPGDFVFQLPPICARLAGIAWGGILVVYCLKEAIRSFSGAPFNLPKNLFISGTFLSWYIGIVHFNADLPFTITNVVSHGVPYIALIWLYERRKADKITSSGASMPAYFKLFTSAALPLFFLIMFLLAYIEEALWDGLVWRDHGEIFAWAWDLPMLSDPKMLALIVPLLALPQSTHYVLDAFIWRIRKPESEVRTILEGETA
jgi:hypothetical protein